MRPQTQSQTAPWSNVPRLRIVGVEHPFIIKNIQKGIETLGGQNSIDKIVAPDGKDAVIGLYLRPEDRMSKPMMSHNVATRNVVLHIVLPKRTGRRRKKGSNEPFLDPAEVNDHPLKGSKHSKASGSPRGRLDDRTKHLLRSLQDNKDNYDAKPVGVIEHTHRFRGMPDFVYSTTNSPFIQKMREYILPFQYDKMKQFALDPSKGVQENTDLIPPPSFSHISIPFIYSYRQNPAVKQSLNSAGHLTTSNTQTALKISTQLVPCDVASVPSTPPPNLAPFDTLDPSLQRTITQLQTLLATRPIWTRRAITNHIVNKEYAQTLKQAFQYVSYMFRSGPWRDAIVTLGLDPRTDPQYRIYQTLMFQLFTRDPDTTTRAQPNTTNREDEPPRDAHTPRPRPRPRPTDSHIFDGVRADLDGKVWQVCDITDPQLRSILDPPSLRAQCDIRSDGWYHNGTWAKARIIMKAKLTTIRHGGVPVDADYARLVHFPDVLDASSRSLAVVHNGSRREVQWAAEIRVQAASPAKRRLLVPIEGAAAAAVGRNGRAGEGAGDESAVKMGGARAIDPRVAESMREIERRGLGVEPGDDGDMDVMENMDVDDVDLHADGEGEVDGDGEGDGDEEAIADSDEMGE